MRITDLHVQMKVRHPQYGIGVVKSVSEQMAQVQFSEGMKTLDASSLQIEQTASMVELDGTSVPVSGFLREVVLEAVERVEQLREQQQAFVDQLGTRWQGGVLVLKPAEGNLQPKELPLERFFHKIVMLRDNLRVLEQKINSTSKLTDAEKVEWQQYITRIYGTLTSFNILFKDKRGQFTGASSD